MIKIDNKLIDEALSYIFIRREIDLDELKMFPKEMQFLAKETLLAKDLIEETKTRYMSMSAVYTLTKKAKEIVIDYGSYSLYLENKDKPVNFLAGINISATHGSNVNFIQGNNNKVLVESLNHIYCEIEKLGVSKNNIEALKELVNKAENSPSQKKTFLKKALMWVGNLTTDVASNLISDNISLILRYVESISKII